VTRHFVGFDLGTTNSAAAVFDGEKVTVARNRQGGVLTPSVVRINAKGVATVGARARGFLESDPANTHGGFKRLMGTRKALRFAAAGIDRLPEELAAEILRSLRADVADQFGSAPTHAVVTVPALFEVPQSHATVKAAKLAGLERVELLQEPVASALAAGWDRDEAGFWLVYDLGGGTFDATLLESREGLLRVVGHDGDNFLGGRDFDAALVDWIVAREGLGLRREEAAHAEAFRRLTAAAEEAKIELSRAGEAAVALPAPLLVDDAEVEVDCVVDRATAERLTLPLVDRSIDRCLALLRAHGLAAAALRHIVLVGGPTAMPALRARIAERLGVAPAEGVDPMTLVVQGAALHAASVGLEAAPVPSAAAARNVVLKFPSMSTDLTPHLLGRCLTKPAPAEVRLDRADGGWSGDWTPVDAEGAFFFLAELAPRRANTFRLTARDADGRAVALEPSTATIVHGVTIGDPPLARTIGVALASDAVRVYFERGAPLPARRTFVHHTVEAAIPGRGVALRIPVVQGDFDEAHLCRLVGAIEIDGAALDRTLPSGTPVEVTLALDRGGNLSAQAYIPAVDRAFESVAHLLVPEATPEVLEKAIGDLRERLVALRRDAFRLQLPAMVADVDRAEAELSRCRAGATATRGGDEDAGQKARRDLLELEAAVGEMEAARRWPELESDAREAMVWAASWMSSHGTPAESRLLDDAVAQVEQAIARRDPRALQLRVRHVRRLGSAAFHRWPGAWGSMFEYAASRAHEAGDLRRATAVVDRGRAALARGDRDAVRAATEELWALLPADVQIRARSHRSGVR
jgi:molecular chaperone DnaK